jgi:hypothetical protein
MQLFGSIVVLVDQASFGPRELIGTGDDGSEHGVEIERRADRTANLGERFELLDRSSEIRGTRLQLLEQAYVLDGDCRVRGEGRQYLDRVRGDRGARVLVIGQKDPDRPAARDHGDDNEALRAQRLDFRIRAAQVQDSRERVRLVESERALVPIGQGHRTGFSKRDC